MVRRYDRRAFLAGLTASSLSLAGCVSGGTLSGISSPSFDSVVSSVTVGTRDVVVELASDDVSEVVLIGPDGSAFDSQTVQTGISIVRFSLIELDLELSTSFHYAPGQYEVAAVADGTKVTDTLLIEPSIRVRDVRQYREGDLSSDLARVVFTVSNVGTGPTWIYDASFNNSPNYTANGGLNGRPSIPYLKTPTTEEELIIAPDETQDYIDTSTPLALPDTQATCEEQLTPFQMQIGVADESIVETVLTPALGGEQVSLSGTGQSVCTQVAIDWESQERGQ